jgi:transcriptional regulator with XRE-family HTH domain
MQSQALSSKSLGRRLLHERRRLGLTQEEVARIAGVTRLTVYNYEKGLYAQPMDYIAPLVSAGFDLGYLMFGTHRIEAVSTDKLSIESFMRIVKLVDEVARDSRGRPLSIAQRQMLIEQLSRLVIEQYADGVDWRIVDESARSFGATR